MAIRFLKPTGTQDVVPGLLQIRVTKNQLPLVITGVAAIHRNTEVFMQKVGKMILDNAQKTIDSEGPGWKSHSAATLIRHPVHPLLNLGEGDPTSLSKITAHFGVEVQGGVRDTSTAKIIPLTRHGAKMFFVHNRPRGTRTKNNVPGRPFIQFRTGHNAGSERTQSRVIMNEYIKKIFRDVGIKGIGAGFEAITSTSVSGRAKLTIGGESRPLFRS